MYPLWAKTPLGNTQGPTAKLDFVVRNSFAHTHGLRRRHGAVRATCSSSGMSGWVVGLWTVCLQQRARGLGTRRAAWLQRAGRAWHARTFVAQLQQWGRRLTLASQSKCKSSKRARRRRTFLCVFPTAVTVTAAAVAAWKWQQLPRHQRSGYGEPACACRLCQRMHITTHAPRSGTKKS